METQVELAHDDIDLVWADTFAMDQDGYLYATTNKLPFIFNNKLDWEEDGPHFRIVRLKTPDKSFLVN
jgi:hypothetical protein